MTPKHGQSHRRSRRILLLLVPLLALRLLVPAGFMVMADAEGGLSIGLCSGFAPATAGSMHGDGHAMHHMHHGAGHGSPDRPDNYSHTPCLFASAAGTAFIPQTDLVAPALGVARRVLLPVQPAVVAAASIDRAQSARGPPVLA